MHQTRVSLSLAIHINRCTQDLDREFQAGRPVSPAAPVGIAMPPLEVIGALLLVTEVDI